MNSKKSLLPALISQAIYYILLILSLFQYGYQGQGYGLAFVFWIIGFLVAFLSILLHIFGAVFNITHKKGILSIAYLILAILAIPLLFTIGASASITEIILWNTYFGILFAISLFCVKKAI